MSDVTFRGHRDVDEEEVSQHSTENVVLDKSYEVVVWCEGKAEFQRGSASSGIAIGEKRWDEGTTA